MIEDSFWESEDVMSEEEASRILEEAAQEAGTEETDEEESESFEEEVETHEEEVETHEEDSQEDLETDLQVLKDASLRLEQGNLYKMLLKHDLFEGVDADPRAIANVQRELRAFIRERLEVLVGLKPDPKIAPKKVEVQLPFSDLEIQLLKEFLGKVTGKIEPQPKALNLKPVKTEQSVSSKSTKIKPIVGSSKNVKVVTPQKAQPKTQAKSQQKQAAPKDEPRLQKPPSEMTPEELMEYNKIVSNRQKGRKAISPNRLPMPDSQQVEAMYTNRVQASGGGALINAILEKMGKGRLGLIEDGGGSTEYTNDDRI
jgi:hypothetical protein